LILTICERKLHFLHWWTHIIKLLSWEFRTWNPWEVVREEEACDHDDGPYRGPWTHRGPHRWSTAHNTSPRTCPRNPPCRSRPSAARWPPPRSPGTHRSSGRRCTAPSRALRRSRQPWSSLPRRWALQARRRGSPWRRGCTPRRARTSSAQPSCPVRRGTSRCRTSRSSRRAAPRRRTSRGRDRRRAWQRAPRRRRSPAWRGRRGTGRGRSPHLAAWTPPPCSCYKTSTWPSSPASWVASQGSTRTVSLGCTVAACTRCRETRSCSKTPKT